MPARIEVAARPGREARGIAEKGSPELSASRTKQLQPTVARAEMPRDQGSPSRRTAGQQGLSLPWEEVWGSSHSRALGGRIPARRLALSRTGAVLGRWVSGSCSGLPGTGPWLAGPPSALS